MDSVTYCEIINYNYEFFLIFFFLVFQLFFFLLNNQSNQKTIYQAKQLNNQQDHNIISNFKIKSLYSENKMNVVFSKCEKFLFFFSLLFMCQEEKETGPKLLF